MTERYAIVDENQTPKLVLDVIEVLEGETFHPPDHIEGWRAVEVPEGLPVEIGWKWTKSGGLKAP